MKTVIALVGRPNVGKSTLFNRLTKSRDAIVADFPGLTRDRQYGMGRVGKLPFIVIDTGGLIDEENELYGSMAQQTWQAVDEADIVCFMVDGRSGMTAADQEIADMLRKRGRETLLLVNKIDGVDADSAMSDFYGLGFEEIIPIAASQNRGIRGLVEIIEERVEYVEEDEEERPEQIIVSIVGRPNVGKSTLINRILGEERVVASEVSGTTRDAIDVEFERDEQQYLLIDTAGVRRRGRIKQTIEKFSVVKTLQAIERSHVCVLLIDAVESLTEQDINLLGFIIDQGRSLIIAVNKWDHLTKEHRDQVKADLERRLNFVDFTVPRFISALHGTGVGDLFAVINKAFESAMVELPTPKLTRILEDAQMQHPPPMNKGRRPKLRYAHQGGKNPPRIIIHGNQTDSIADAYTRYLERTYRKVLKVQCTPVKIEFRSGDNPYAGKRNILTPRQIHKKRKNIQFYKKKSKSRS